MQEKLPEKASPIVFTDEGLFQIVPSFPKSVDIIKVIGIVYSPNMSDTDPTIFREKKCNFYYQYLMSLNSENLDFHCKTSYCCSLA